MALLIVSKDTPKCPHHKSIMQKVAGQYGPYYRCEWKQCDITASVSPHNGLFYITDQETRDARHVAHAAFDKLWRSELMTRQQAYEWLARALGIDRKECHIRYFTVRQCELVTVLSEIRFLRLQEKGAPSGNT